MSRRRKRAHGGFGPAPHGELASALSSSDGRWAVVSTSLTAVVAGTIAWLALGTLPPNAALQPESSSRAHSLLPYKLFQQLARTSRESYASLGPVGPEPREIDARGLSAIGPNNSGVDSADVESHTITLDRGDTLAGALTDAGATRDDAAAAVAALARVLDIRTLRAGLNLNLRFQSATPTPIADSAVQHMDDLVLGGSGGGTNIDASGSYVEAQGSSGGKLLSVALSPSIDHDVTIARASDGTFSASDAVLHLSAQVHRASARIDSSLYLAAMQAGIPAEVVVEMIHMFSYKVDFQRDIRPGDSFEVFYDYYYTPDGRPAKEGNVSYAVMNLGDRQIALYRYQPDPNEPADYFDAHGQSAKGMLMKTPVDGARITSGFGMRFHPILGYTRMHKGVDFGVPIGTPVMAAGAGIVTFMGVEHGYGNFVLIDHGNGYATAYGHLSRFSPGIHRGARVRQGQIFAYSGMSGMATGPHLHYEVRINNIQVNPATVKVAQGRKLEGHELRDYLMARLHTDALVANTPLQTRLADANSELRQAKSQ